MEQTIQDLRTNVAQDKQKIVETVQKVEDKIDQLTDVKSLVNRYPWVTFGASIALGALLIGFSKRGADHRHEPEPVVDCNERAVARTALLSLVLPRFARKVPFRRLAQQIKSYV